MDNNNSVGVIIVGVLGFIAIVIAGKWLLDNNRCRDGHCHPRQQQMAPQYPQRPNQPYQRPRHDQGVNINIQAPPSCPSHYHNRNEFWFGYRDGYNGRRPNDNCPEYLHGYRQGAYDRSRNCHDYFDRHCPNGFHLRVPGFKLDIH